MAASLNRPAVVINLSVFVVFSVFCISTEAPLIQEDILKRCRDELSITQIPLSGLSVDGRDVILRGPAGSRITNAQVQSELASLPGVRLVRVKIDAGDVSRRNTGYDKGELEPAGSDQQRELQAKIDRVLENQNIAFTAESAVLTAESQSILDKIALDLAEVPSLRCEIRGYDHHPPDARKNWALALQRALATEDYLVSKGIAEWRLSTHAFQNGEGAEGRRTDRAVDLVVKAQ